MNTRKLRYLKASDYIKVSAPVVILLCVFFFKTMIQSTIEGIFNEKLAGVKSGMVLNVDKSDAEFIKALLDSSDFRVFEPFLLSEQRENPFLKGLFNIAVQQEEIPEDAGIIPETEEIIIPAYTVSTVLNGNMKKYAVVDRIAVNVGSTLPNGDVVTAISEGRVLIEGQWGKKWFYVSY